MGSAKANNSNTIAHVSPYNDAAAPSTAGSTRVVTFVTTATAEDGAGHSIGLTRDGDVYTWGRTNGLGQLGRSGRSKTPTMVPNLPAPIVRAYVGGFKDSGHTVLLDRNGHLWVTGCDRWQQLGLGSWHGGAGGYAWTGGKVFQTEFQRNSFVLEYVKTLDSTASIRDVAVGGDHTVVLSSNQKDVIAFGKGAEGQLGLNGKRFLSAAAKSPVLSGQTNSIAAVCAIEHCSLTLGSDGEVLNTAGKCRMDQSNFSAALKACQKRASTAKLV